MAGYGGGDVSIRPLKKSRIPWSNGALGYGVKVDGKAETLVRTGISPASATYLENHFMASDWKASL